MSESNVKPELESTLADLVRESTAGLAEHPDPDQVFAYRSRRLSAQESEALEDHLSFCADCVDLLLLDPEIPADETPEGVADFETRRAGRDVAARFEARRQLREAEERLQRQRRHARWSQIAAVGCLATAAALVFAPSAPAPAPTAAGAPQASVGIVDVTRNVLRGEGSDTIVTPVEIPPATPLVVLVFPLDPGDFEFEKLEILDAAGHEVWTTREIVVRDAVATLSLPRGFLEAGEYMINIYGRQGSDTTVWEHLIGLDYL